MILCCADGIQSKVVAVEFAVPGNSALPALTKKAPTLAGKPSLSSRKMRLGRRHKRRVACWLD